jgi:xanthine dehydrogenase large subunit
MHGYCGKTNTQSNTAFRGFGGPQGAIAIETSWTASPAAGARPLACGAPTSTAGERNVTPYLQPVSDNVIHELVDSWPAATTGRRAAVAAFNADSPVLKRGLALTPVKFGISFNVKHFNQAGALVHIYTDGSVLVNHGGTEMGQGLNTKVAQVVAHELGVASAACADGHRHQQGGQHLGHGGLHRGRPERQGRAGRRAPAARAPGRLRRRAMAAPARCALPTARCRWAARRWPSPPWSEAYLDRVQLWSDGFYATPGLHWDKDRMQGHPFYYFAYGAAVSEVVVDTLTGEWKLLRADVLHDVGRSLNPAVDIGQVEGAFIQGMGWLTTEELVWHRKTGLLTTHAPSTYKIPTANDCPPVFNVRCSTAPTWRTRSTAARPWASRRCCCPSRCSSPSATRSRPRAGTGSIRRCGARHQRSHPARAGRRPAGRLKAPAFTGTA